MSRDIKLNWNQLSEGQLKRKVDKYHRTVSELLKAAQKEQEDKAAAQEA
jgi:hypothetical protein